LKRALPQQFKRTATAAKAAPSHCYHSGRVASFAPHICLLRKAGFPVIGLMDQDGNKASALAAERRIPHSFGSVAEAVRFAARDAIFDVAVPASQLVHILPQLPDNAAVLIQKPMGENLARSARHSRPLPEQVFHRRRNFSLRYSPK